MLIISEDVAKKVLSAPLKQTTQKEKEFDKEVKKSVSGRRQGDKNMTPFSRGIAGAISIIEGSKAATEVVKVSQNHTYALQKGKHVHGGPVVESLRKRVNAHLDEAEELASQKLVSCLSFISDEEIAVANLKTKVAAAAGLSKVLQNIKDKSPSASTVNNVILYAPDKQKEESEYEVVEV